MADIDGLVDARRRLAVAESMITRTYSLSQDPKILLAVAEDIYAALFSSIRAVLADSRLPEGDFSAIFAAFRDISEKYGFDQDDLYLLQAIQNIISGHDSSPVEFARKGSFVMCDAGYNNCEAISFQDMQKYLFRARLFIGKVEKMLMQRDNKK